jgi:hypothetical protein
MLVRTVSFYSDGKPIDRPQLCVSPELTAGNIDSARQLAEDLDRRGYLPPKQPMSRQENRDIEAPSDFHRQIIWEVCGRGVPLGAALAHGGVPVDKQKNARRKMQKLIRKIGWGGEDEKGDNAHN